MKAPARGFLPMPSLTTRCPPKGDDLGFMFDGIPRTHAGPRVRVRVVVVQTPLFYEEFHPFGTSSYSAANSAIDVSAKRYRYIGKERDEETGLYSMGARYYACWLGRWTRPDSAGLVDGPGRYSYARNNPVRLSDPGGTLAQDPEEPKPVFGGSAGVLVTTGRGSGGRGPTLLSTEGDPVLEKAPSLAVEGGGPKDFVKRAQQDPNRIRDFEKFGQDIRKRADETAASVAAGTGVLFAAGGAGVAGAAVAGGLGFGAIGTGAVVGGFEETVRGAGLELLGQVEAGGEIDVGAVGQAGLESGARGAAFGAAGGAVFGLGARALRLRPRETAIQQQAVAGEREAVQQAALENFREAAEISTFQAGKFREITLQPGRMLERAFEEGVSRGVGQSTVRPGGVASRRLTSGVAATRELALAETSGAIPTAVSTLEVTEAVTARIGFIKGGGKGAIQIVVREPAALREIRALRRTLPFR